MTLSFRAPAARRLVAGALAAAALALAGCASTSSLDSSVQTYAALAGLPAQAGYRYERLPSQDTDPAQPRLEAWADASLARVGLRRDDAQPRYSVQVWNRLQRVSYPGAAFPPVGGWGSIGFGSHSGVGIGLGMGFPIGGWGDTTPWYQREVGLVMRELPGGRVVYETRAYNEGHWIAPERVLPAMLDAALQGYPQPAAGVRRVATPLVR